MVIMLMTNNINGIKLPYIKSNELAFLWNPSCLISEMLCKISSISTYQKSMFLSSFIETRNSSCLKSKILVQYQVHHLIISIMNQNYFHIHAWAICEGDILIIPWGLPCHPILQLNHKIETIYHAYLVVFKYMCTFLIDTGSCSIFSISLSW